MDDLERTLREGLRAAAANKPPLGDVDLDLVAAAGARAPHRPQRWLALAAALLVVAGIGVWAWRSQPGDVPALPAANPTSAGLVGTSWLATEIDGQPVVADAAGDVPSLTFVTDLHGYGGQPCNNMSINYGIDGSNLEFKGLSTHDIGCGSQQIAAQQARFSDALLRTSRFRQSAETLELTELHGTVVLRFRSTDFAGPTPTPVLPNSTPTTTGTSTGAPVLGPCQMIEAGRELHTNRVTVQVVGLGQAGLAKLTSLYLRTNGFRVISFLERPNAAKGTTIRGSSADSPEVKLVQHFFPGSVAEGDGRAEHIVDVLVAAQAQVDDPAASVPVTSPLCLPPITGEVVQVRVRNDSGAALNNVVVTFPGGNRDEFGDLAPGAASDYVDVATAYRYARVQAVSSGRTLRLMPADYVGEKELKPGLYTYALGVDAGELTLKLVTDR